MLEPSLKTYQELASNVELFIKNQRVDISVSVL